MTIFAIMAIGLNIVAGFAGLLDLGYVAFYAIGAYTAAFLASPHFGALGINLTSSATSGRAPPGSTCRTGSSRSSRSSWSRRSARCSAHRPSACAATTWRS